MEECSSLGQRLRAGRPTALVGTLRGVPAGTGSVEWIFVDSEGHGPFATLMSAEREIAARRGVEPERLPRLHPFTTSEPQRRDAHTQSFFELLESARAGAPTQATVVFGNVEAADDESLELFRHWVLRGAALPVPIVFQFESAAPRGKAGELLDAIELVEGERAVIELEVSEESVAIEERLARLPVNARSVLRAAAALGSTFRAEQVAALTRIGLLDVLECLQLASDAGIDIEELEDGRFSIEPAAARVLRSELLPSLVRAYGEAGAAEAPSTARRSSAPPSRSSRPDALRPREEDAGGVREAAESYALAARKLSARGNYSQAAKLVARALAILEQLPEADAARRLLAVRVRIELARIRSQSAFGEGFDLSSALASLESCQRELRPSDPIELRADLSHLIAEICSEIGTPGALERALIELEGGRRALLESGQSLELVKFLNCEAALLLKLGHPEQAGALAAQVPKVLERLDAREPEVISELAESHHVLARRVLHASRESVQATPDPTDPKTLELALSAATRAEDLYRQLDSPQQLARVWLTLGRLERLAGRHKEAFEHLRAADSTQRELGDVLGAARTAGAFADLALDAGDHQHALAALAESVEFNAERGSALGLMYNRATLDRLITRLPSKARSEVGPGVLELLARISLAMTKQERPLERVVSA